MRTFSLSINHLRTNAQGSLCFDFNLDVADVLSAEIRALVKVMP